MPKFAERTCSPTKAKRLNDLFELIKDSRDPVLSDIADDMLLRKTLGGAFDAGLDSKETEQTQFQGSNSDKNVSNSQAAYDKEKLAWRTRGTNGSDFDTNRAEVLRESGNRDALVLKNARRSAGQDAMTKATYR